MKPNNYFKITESMYFVRNNSTVHSARIIALYPFNGSDQNSIKDAYDLAVLKLRKLMKETNVSSSSSPFRITTWKPIIVTDFREYKLLHRDNS